MSLEQVTRLRDLAGKVAAVCCVVFILAAFDGLILHLKQPENAFDLLPGGAVKLNGSLKENVKSLDDLGYAADSALMRLTFEATHTGFWLGGFMWRGLLTLNPEIPPGEYSLAVSSKDNPREKPSSVFKIRVYEDAQQLRKNSNSMMLRYLNTSPWWVLIGFLALTCMAFGTVFFFSHKRESLLAFEGKAEVYHIRKGDDGYEITFGLGTHHGLQSGDSLILLDEKGKPVGNIEVRQVFEHDSMGVVGLSSPVKPGFIVWVGR